MSTTYYLRPALSQMVPEAFIHLERLIIGMEKMNRGWHTHTKHSLSGLLGKGSKSAGRQLCPFTSLHVAIFFFTDLKFVATVATGGRVKFLSDV